MSIGTEEKKYNRMSDAREKSKSKSPFFGGTSGDELSAEEAAELNLARPRRSNALKLWFAIVAGVLILLFFQTKNSPYSELNLLVNGDENAVGAQVAIDGHTVGVMKASGDTGVGGSEFWAHLSNGNHKVVVTKDGYKPFSREFSVYKQAYLSVELKAKADMEAKNGQLGENKKKDDNSASTDDLVGGL